MKIYNFNPDDAMRFVQEQGLAPCKHRGAELATKYCPYCRGRTRDTFTFSINLDTGAFNCMREGCKARGNMLTLAKDFDFSLGRDADEYYRQVKQYKSLRNYPVPKSKPEAIEYLAGRGISKSITDKYHITVHKNNPKVLVMPFYDEHGILQFIKYRNTDPQPGQNKEWSMANCKPILFGMDHCTDPNGSDTLVMTEGQIDALSVAQAFGGHVNVVSVPTGANGFTWVPYCWDFLNQFKILIVFGDHENDHITLLDEMTVRFHGLVKHVHPDDYKGCKDANELLQKFGAKAVQDAVLRAVPVPNERIIDIADISWTSPNDKPHFSTGIKKLDAITGGFAFGSLVVLTGERGKGKSTLASQFGIHAISQGRKVFFYSGELSDTQFRDWFYRQVAGDGHIYSNISPLGYKYYRTESDVLEQIADWHREKAYLYNNAIVRDGDENETLLETGEKAIKQYGCDVLIFDNLMTAMSDDVQSDLYRQQSNFVGKLVKMANAYNVLVILVVHPRKQSKGFDNNKIDNDDISGSADITNMAHTVLHYTIPKTGSSDRVLRVLKNRSNGHVDYDGIPLWFEESSKRISQDAGRFDFDFGWETHEEPNAPDEGFVEADDGIPFDTEA